MRSPPLLSGGSVRERAGEMCRLYLHASPSPTRYCPGGTASVDCEHSTGSKGGVHWRAVLTVDTKNMSDAPSATTSLRSSSRTSGSSGTPTARRSTSTKSSGICLCCSRARTRRGAGQDGRAWTLPDVPRCAPPALPREPSSFGTLQRPEESEILELLSHLQAEYLVIV